MFTIVPIFIGVIFCIVIGSIILRIASGVAEWGDNNNQPELDENARVVSKRMEVAGGEKSTSTKYFATFELPQGVRRELKMNGSEYGLLAEDDAGRLRYQGTRYLGFERMEQPEAPAAEAPNPAPANLACDYCGSAIPAGSIKCAGCGWTWHPTPQDRAMS